MTDENYKGYIIDCISLLKQQAVEAKQDADETNSDQKQDSYNQGHLMAYYSVLTLLKRQASVLNIDENELGLADIDPEKNLLGLERNPKL